MNIADNKYLAPVVAFWRKQSKKRKIIFFSVLGGVVLLSVAAALLLNRQSYAVLYSGLDETEAAEVMQLLQEADTAYKYQSGGVIQVPEEEEAAVRMQLADEGYPKSASNYDFFTENVDVMTTDYEKKLYKLYQLQERLATAIKTISGIKDAIVTIAMPETSGYVWEAENSEEPTASVVVKLADDVTLSESQIKAIKLVVSTSVLGMDMEKVTVVDNNGNELSESDDQMTYVDINLFKLEIENQFQKQIEDNVLKVMEPLFGENNVMVSAKSNMNLDKKIQEYITYFPVNDETDTGIISEQQSDYEIQGEGTVSGVPGTETNSDVSTYANVTVDGDNILVKDYKTYKYLVSQLTEQVQHDTADLTDLTIAVTINKDDIPQNQLASLKQIAANAAGVNENKIAIYNAAFFDPNANPEPESPGEQGFSLTPQQLLYLAVAGGSLLLILIGVLIVMGRRSKKKKAKLLAEQALLEATQAQEQEEPVPEFSVELQNMKDTKEQALKKGIQDFSSQNPEIVAQLIKTWLKGDEDAP